MNELPLGLNLKIDTHICFIDIPHDIFDTWKIVSMDRNIDLPISRTSQYGYWLGTARE